MRRTKIERCGPSISHDEALVTELRGDPEFAAEYLAAAREDLDDPGVFRIAKERCERAGWTIDRAENS